jgi:hypothetical protein
MRSYILEDKNIKMDHLTTNELRKMRDAANQQIIAIDDTSLYSIYHWMYPEKRTELIDLRKQIDDEIVYRADCARNAASKLLQKHDPLKYRRPQNKI